MKGKSFVLAGVACAALTACATTGTSWRPNVLVWNWFEPRFSTSRIDCKVADCSIDVAVVQDPVTGNCIPEVVRVVDLSLGPPGERIIEWRITTPDYEFSKEDYKYGIFIKTNPFDQFKDAQVISGGKTLRLKFANTKRDKFAYGLTVRQASGQKAFCDTLDPWLIS